MGGNIFGNCKFMEPFCRYLIRNIINIFCCKAAHGFTSGMAIGKCQVGIFFTKVPEANADAVICVSVIVLYVGRHLLIWVGIDIT